MYGSMSPLRVALGVSGSLLSLGLALAQAQNPAGSQQAPNAPGAVSGQAGQGQSGQGQSGQGQSGQAGQSQSGQAGQSQSGQAGQSGQSQSGQAGQAGHGQAGHGAMRSGGQIGDREMASALLVDNQGEVAMAQFVLQKTQNQEVRQFAQKLIDDHQRMIDSLKQAGASESGAGQGSAAGQGSRSGSSTAAQGQPGSDATAGTDRRNSVTPGAAELQAGQGQGGATDFASLKHELGQQCLQSSQRELSSKQGAELDKCYIGMQVFMHQHAADTMTVFRRHAGEQLGRTIDEGLPVVQAHLEHAKQLMKQLESSSPSTADKSDQPKR
jgi:predicted outer membrane protein